MSQPDDQRLALERLAALADAAVQARHDRGDLNAVLDVIAEQVQDYAARWGKLW